MTIEKLLRIKPKNILSSKDFIEKSGRQICILQPGITFWGPVTFIIEYEEYIFDKQLYSGYSFLEYFDGIYTKRSKTSNTDEKFILVLDGNNWEVIKENPSIRWQ